MPNLYVSLPAPAANGVGAAVNTSAFGKVKTIVVGNSVAAPFLQTITIEVSENAGFDFAPIISITQPGKISLPVAAQFMRVRVSGFISGAADVEVGANSNAGMFTSLPVPAGDGFGAPVATTDFGLFKSVIVAQPAGGTFSGSVHIEASEDGVVFTDCLTFTEDDIQSKHFYAAFVRVRRSGFDPDLPGLPVVDLGAVNDTISAVVPGPVPTRQQVYDASIPADILLAAANGPIIFRDNPVPIGLLLAIQDSGGTPLVSSSPAEFDVTTPIIDLNGATIVDIDSAVEVEITAPTVDIDAALIVDIDSAVEVEITAPLIDIDGAVLVDIDSAAQIDITAPVIDIDAATIVDIDSAVEVEITAPTVDIDGATIVDIDGGLVDIDAVTILSLGGDMVDINAVTDVMIDAPLIDITAATLLDLNSPVEVEINAPLLDVNVTTLDIDAVTIITLDAPTINLTATTLGFTGTPTFTLLGTGPMLVIEPTATSGTVTIAQELRRDSGGVGAIGDGVAQNLSIMNSAGAPIIAFQTAVEWTDATAGTEDSEVFFSIRIAGLFAEGLRIRANVVDTQLVTPFALIISPNSDLTDGMRISTIASDVFVIPLQATNAFFLGNSIADPSVDLNRLAARAFDIVPLGTTITSNSPGDWIVMASTIVINVPGVFPAGGSLGGFVAVSGSIEFRLAGSAFGAGNLFKLSGTIKNESGALVSIGSQYTFVNTGTYQADGAYTQANFFFRVCLFQATWSVINGALMTVATLNGGGLINHSILAGVTVTNRRDWEWSAGTVTGTITEWSCIWVPDITTGTTFQVIRSFVAAGATRRFILHSGTAESDFGGTINLTGVALLNHANSDALGGGAAATLGTIGGSGPTVAAQSTWVRVELAGVVGWIAMWI